MKNKIKLLLIMLLTSIKLSAINSITLEELNNLRDQGALTNEDYEILKREIQSSDNQEELYTLKVNSKTVSNDYKLLKSQNQYYLNLDEFFKNIEFNNYTKNNDEYKILLGKSLDEVIINLDKKEVKYNKKLLTFPDLKEIIIIDSSNEPYLHENVFKDLFLNSLNINENQSKITMDLNFMTPDEISKLLDLSEKTLNEETLDNTLLFKSKRQLFDLGYTRITAERSFVKEQGEKSYKGEWNTGFEYQGGLLYGQLKSKYNLEDNLIEYLTLEYNDIWKGHTLNFENTGSKSQGRTWSFGFFKDKSYYLDGNRAIIKETVPVGSRVELKYMGTSVAIQNEKNGMVVFDNDIIKADKTYELVIYYPDGKIVTKTITPVEDYNKQDKGQVQYTVYFNEDDSSKKYSKDLNFYYGLTDSLTVGAGYNQGIENINDSYKYTNNAFTSFVYGNTINGYSYILNLKMEKSLDSYKYYEKDYNDKYTYEGEIQLNIKDFKYTLKNEYNGKFYDEKEKRSLDVEWNFSENLTLSYFYEETYKYLKDKSKKSDFSVDFDKSYKGVLFSLGASIDEKSEQSYNVGLYYTGKNNITTRLETKWNTRDSKETETTLTVYNNDFLGLFDYNFEVGYSPKYKDKFTFNFSMNYDNWIKIASIFDKDGRQSHTIGLDRIVDLKNLKENVDSLDVSRVKAITYVDENNNNKYDVYEKKVEGVEVTIANKTQITNSNGETIFSNISNGIITDLKPIIKKPSYSLGDNKIQVKGEFSSTIEAYIPIKPLINLEGFINIDPDLKLSEEEKEKLYEDILVEIKDNKGKSLELTIPDNTGMFDVSGLFPEEYVIEVHYVGTNFKVNPFKENLKLVYSEETSDFKIVFDFKDNKIIARK